MIHYAAPARRAWAFALALVVDLVVLEAMRAVVGSSGSVLVPFAAWCVVHHVGLVVEGGTLGHRLVGLRVVRTDGERVGVAMAAVRACSFLALSVPPLGLGLLWMLDQPERRTWHDITGGTVVVREESAAASAAPAWAEAPPWRREVAPQRPADRDEDPATPVDPA